ncbi:hypothetical protein [Rhodopirellula bahusiensis]|nr:hypothetical protein [Rhodopirellula bahusiensis]
MLPLFVASVCIAAFLFWQTGKLRLFVAPCGVIALWLMLRFKTPPDGMTVTTIRSTPGAVVLLWFMAATLVVGAIVIGIDVYIIGHPFRAPLEPYHAFFYSPPFVIMFAGVYFADRLQRSSR